MTLPAGVRRTRDGQDGSNAQHGGIESESGERIAAVGPQDVDGDVEAEDGQGADQLDKVGQEHGPGRQRLGHELVHLDEGADGGDKGHGDVGGFPAVAVVSTPPMSPAARNARKVECQRLTGRPSRPAVLNRVAQAPGKERRHGHGQHQLQGPEGKQEVEAPFRAVELCSRSVARHGPTALDACDEESRAPGALALPWSRPSATF